MRLFKKEKDPKLEKVVNLLFAIVKRNEAHFRYKVYYLLFSYIMHLGECAKCREEANIPQDLLEAFYQAYREAGVDIELGKITHPPEHET